VPNARDTDIQWKVPSFLLAGYPGSGKSIQEITLPGKKFAYIFDPNTLPTIKGSDIDYEIFLPEPDDVNLAAMSLTKGVGDKPRRRKEPQTYMNWEADFDERHESGFFKGYDWVILDSWTGFLDIAMDRILYINGRPGKQPEQSDWGAQVQLMSNVARVLSSYELGLMATAHLDFKKNDVSGKVFHHLYVTGKLRVRLPQLFSNIFVCHATSDDKGRFWQFQTAPDKEYPTVRCQWNDVTTFWDATIYDLNSPHDYGLGLLLKQHGYGGAPAASTPRAATTKRK
jgi:hypothetical protein